MIEIQAFSFNDAFQYVVVKMASLAISVHYSDVIMSRWRLKSPASRLFTQPFIQAQIKEHIKAARHCPLGGEFTGEFPAQRASNAENVSIWWHHHERNSHCAVTWKFVYTRITRHHYLEDLHSLSIKLYTLIARFMGPTWGPSGADRSQMDPMLATWTLLSGIVFQNHCRQHLFTVPLCCLARGRCG